MTCNVDSRNLLDSTHPDSGDGVKEWKASCWHHEGATLEGARRMDASYGPGSIAELSFKHMLALNLRKLQGGELSFAPRSYVLQPDNGMQKEFEAFTSDFKLSQAFAVLARVSEGLQIGQPLPVDEHEVSRASKRQPEALWGRELPDISWKPGPDPAKPIEADCISTALGIIQRAVIVQHRSQVIDIDDQEWHKIQCFSPLAPLIGCNQSLVDAAASALATVPRDLQLHLARTNLWALKPSCGQFGRGILLLDRLPENPEQLLQWAISVGRGGQKGAIDSKEGCILQKLVERPHLVDPKALMQEPEECCGILWQLPAHQMGSLGTEAQRPGLYKYNMRMWVLGTLAETPKAWLYNEGFVSLAAKDFTPELDTLSHITNLRQVGSDAGKTDAQRHVPISHFKKHFDHCYGANAYDTRVRAQVRHIIQRVFDALAHPPSSLASLGVIDPEQFTAAASASSPAGKLRRKQENEDEDVIAIAAPAENESSRRLKLRRMGLDLLLDADLRVWLIEVNFLKNGYATGYAQKGPLGDVKRSLVRQLIQDETELRVAVLNGIGTVPEAFEQILPSEILH